MNTEKFLLKLAKEFAATYCVNLSEKQHNKFVIALSALLRSVFEYGRSQ